MAEYFVVVTERDRREDTFARPLVFETYLDKACIELARKRQERLNGAFGKTRIAKLVFIDEEA